MSAASGGATPPSWPSRLGRGGLVTAVSLTRKERRVFRGIERALTVEDPELASLLGDPPAPATRARVLARFAWSFFLQSMILLSAGLILYDSALLAGGLCVLGVFPPLILHMGAALRGDR
jgi:hypothetical protein